MKAIFSILFLLLLLSCKRNFTCVCKEYGSPAGERVVSSKNIYDTKKNAQEQCKVAYDCGGCQLK